MVGQGASVLRLLFPLNVLWRTAPLMENRPTDGELPPCPSAGQMADQFPFLGKGGQEGATICVGTVPRVGFTPQESPKDWIIHGASNSFTM